MDTLETMNIHGHIRMKPVTTKNPKTLSPVVFALVAGALTLPVRGQPPAARPATPVVVQNEESSPVPVTGGVRIAGPVFIKELPKEKIQIHDVTLIAAGDTGFGVFGYGKSIYTVPEGKRLLLETVVFSASDDYGPGVNYSAKVAESNVGGLRTVMTTKGRFSPNNDGRAAQTISAGLVVNAGEELTYQFIRDVSSAGAGTSITVVGTLEDMP